MLKAKELQASPIRLIALTGLIAGACAFSNPASAESKQSAKDRYLSSSMAFEANRGQTAPEVRYMARGAGYSLFLTDREAVLSLLDPRTTSKSSKQAMASTLRVKLDGARNTAPVGQSLIGNNVNYFIGDQKNWRSNVATYRQVRYNSAYPGIDLVYYGSQRQLEYDFVVAPNADPNQIKMQIAGAKPQLKQDGSLDLKFSNGSLTWRRPVIYQTINGNRKPVEGRFVIWGSQRVGFSLGQYDHSQPLVIDPVVTYATYLAGSQTGGNVDNANGIATDVAGNAYITGRASSADFPKTANTYTTDPAHPAPRSYDAFIAKLSPSGSSLLFSTFIGGTGYDTAYGIAVDALGQIYICGTSIGLDFPTTVGAFSPHSQQNYPMQGNLFWSKFNADGSQLLYSTCMVGDGDGCGIAVDTKNQVYVVGGVYGGFPTTPNAYDSAYLGGRPVTLARFNPVTANSPTTLYTLAYSTYWGTSGTNTGTAIAVDNNGTAVITGYGNSQNFPLKNPAQTYPGGGFYNGFVAKFNTNLSGAASLVYATYVGGFGNSNVDGQCRYGIAMDSAGVAYVGGFTSATNFPTTVGGTVVGSNPHKALWGNTDIFLAKYSKTGAKLASTLIGGSGDDELFGLRLDKFNNVYITGRTGSTNYPLLSELMNNSTGGRAFLTILNSALDTIIWSTCYGGTQGEFAEALAISPNADAVYVAGDTASANFPTVNAFQPVSPAGHGPFVLKIAFPIPLPAPTINDLGGTLLALGTTTNISVFGTNFLAGAVVYWNGAPLTTTFVNQTKVTVSVPGNLLTVPTVAVINLKNPDNQTSGNMPVQVLNPVPTTTVLQPTLVNHGGPTFTLTVKGSKFNSTSVINWNGVPMTTVFVASNKLTASIPANLITSVGFVQVTVTNPPLGGGTSVPLTLTIQ